jgi:hypothetical protein
MPPMGSQPRSQTAFALADSYQIAFIWASISSTISSDRCRSNASVVPLPPLGPRSPLVGLQAWRGLKTTIALKERPPVKFSHWASI